MDFDSLKRLLASNEMEEVLVPPSEDIFNIHCKKDGDYVNTIQVVQDHPNKEAGITARAKRLLEKAMRNHNGVHAPNYHVSLYEDVQEPAFKIQY